MRRAFAITALLLASALADAQAPYQPQAKVHGTIRIRGHDRMQAVVDAWIAGFKRFHPEARFETTLQGTGTAMPGLYSGNADIALLGREDNVTDDNGFSRPKQYAPTRYELMNGSLASPDMTPALVVYVNRDNPLARLTLAELDAIFGCERRRGHADVRTWGDLGLRGTWAREPIHLHAFDMAGGTGVFFQHVVSGDSRKMKWEALTEHRSTHDIVAAMASDRDAIGIATLAAAVAGVKALPLAVDAGGPFVAASEASVIARSYPLARRTYAFVDQQPGLPLDAKVKEFLRYALSREGQEDVARTAGYLPLAVPTAVAQAARLDRVSALEKAATSDVAKPALRFVADLPAYAPREQVGGTITLWGHGSPKRDFMGPLVKAWIEEFQRRQPGVKFDDRMYGTASAIGALYTGAGNLAMLGEEISPDAAIAFRRAKGYAPTGIEIATGSLDANYFDYAHMVFVHEDNPLRSLTLAQLEAIFGTEHKRSAGNIRTWGEAGVKGPLASCPIRPYGWKVDEDFALFFREAVLEGSHRWNPSIREYVHGKRADGTQYDHGARILDALASDPCGIAISNVRYANANVRPLPLARTADDPAYVATPASLIAQDYPLTRIIPAFIDVPPGQGPEPAVREFLRFILSREGQQALVERSDYLPLGAAAIRKQLARLDALEHAGPARAAASAPPAPAVPTLRIRGSAPLRPVIARWAAAFAARHPEARIDVAMPGSDVAMAELYTGQADVALIGREATPNEVKAFEWIHRYRPAGVAVAAGSTDAAEASPAPVAYVHRDNPLASIRPAQLAALFLEHPDGKALRTWGDLGLTGAWADKPVNLYTFDTTSGSGVFLRHALMDDRRDLHWERITEFGASWTGRFPVDDAGRKILAALARDRYGLAVASGPATAEVRAVPMPYPLARTVYAYFERKPDAGPDPRVAEFLRYALGPEGQRDVAEASDYRPLPPASAHEQPGKLD